MLKKVSSGKLYNKSDSVKSMPEVGRSLKIGSIYPADIIKELGNNKFLLNLLGYEIIAESNLSFYSKKINVQVQKKSPRIILKILNIDFSENNELIDFVQNDNIVLDTFNQNLISLLINHSYHFKKNNFKRDLITISNFTKNIPSFNLIPFSFYLKFYETNPESFMGIMKFLSGKNDSLSAYDDFFYNNDSFIESLIYTIKNLLQSENTHKKTILNNEFLYNLEEFNKLFYPEYFLETVCLETEQISLILFVQGSCKKSKDLEIVNYFFPIPMQPFNPLFIDVKTYNKDIKITYLCDQKMIHDKLKTKEPLMKKSLSNSGYKLLPFQYDIVPFASFYDTIV